MPSSPYPNELKEAHSRGWYLIFLSLVFSIFANLLILTGPLFMLQVYDRVLGSHSEETLVALSILVAFLYAMMALLDFARGRVMARLGARLQSALDPRVFEVTIRRALHPAFRSRPDTAPRDLEAVQAFYASPVLMALLDIPWTPIFIAAIFVLHPMLGWLAIAGGSLLIALALLNQVLTVRRVAQAQIAVAQAQMFAEEARQASEVVRAQGMMSDIASRWMSQREDALRQSISASDRSGAFSAVTRALRLFLQSAILAVGAYYVLRNEMTGGAMVAGSILLGRALAPIEQSIGQWSLVQRAFSGWTALTQVLAKEPPEPQRTSLPMPAATLRVQGLAVIPPGASVPTLWGVTFTLSPGEAIGVIGRSGSGKTSLARALLGIWAPSAGEIRLGGAMLDQYDAAALGCHIGYLPQEPTLFVGTVAENIARMSRRVDPQAVIDAAQKANVHELALSLPKGYDTVINGGNCQLSGGQKQRIALARAFFGNPVLLILDEPNSSLDSEGAEALNLAIRAYKKDGRAVVIMTHRPMAISECDRLMVIDQGRIAKIGPRDDVLKSIMQNTAAINRTLVRAGT